MFKTLISILLVTLKILTLILVLQLVLVLLLLLHNGHIVIVLGLV